MPDDIPDVVELYLRVGDLVKRPDLAAMFKSVLRLAERRIFRTLRFWAMETTVTLTPDAQGVIALPADFLEIRHVCPTGGGGLRGGDLTGMSLHALTARYGSGSGSGRAYATVGSTLVVRPVSQQALDVTYYARPPSLADVSTNAVLQAAPDVYLYGVAREMGVSAARDPQLVQLVDPLYMSAVQALEVEDLSRRFGMQAVRLPGPTP